MFENERQNKAALRTATMRVRVPAEFLAKLCAAVAAAGCCEKDFVPMSENERQNEAALTQREYEEEYACAAPRKLWGRPVRVRVKVPVESIVDKPLPGGIMWAQVYKFGDAICGFTPMSGTEPKPLALSREPKRYGNFPAKALR